MYASKLEQNKGIQSSPVYEAPENQVFNNNLQTFVDSRDQSETQLNIQCKADESKKSVQLKKMQLLADKKSSSNAVAQMQLLADSKTQSNTPIYQLMYKNASSSASTFVSTSTAQLKAKENTDSGVIQMQRYQRKPPFQIELDRFGALEAPAYQNSGVAGAGGNLSTGLIGPGLNNGTRANPRLPAAIVRLRNVYGMRQLKAGHLLNQRFGGDGDNSNNLTILSATGNANHRAFDNPVGNAVAALRGLYQFLWNNNIDLGWARIGIRVTVQVDTTNTWPGERQIFRELDCHAQLVNNHDADIRLDLNNDPNLIENYEGHLDRINGLLDEANGASPIQNTIVRPARARAFQPRQAALRLGRPVPVIQHARFNRNFQLQNQLRNQRIAAQAAAREARRARRNAMHP